MAGSAAVRSVLDKRANLELARRLEIPCPLQFELDSVDRIPELIERIGFPIVLKNPGTDFASSGPDVGFRVRFARDERELREYVDHCAAVGRFPLFQELATGTVHNLCCFASGGEVLAAHEYHSVRRLDGLGVLRRITPADPALEDYARRMLGALEWDGMAHLGFFVDRERNRVCYMETNGRVWGSVQGSVDAGWDFPFWTYDLFMHDRRPDPGPLRMGSRTCWHAGDLKALVNYLRGGTPPSTGAKSGRLRAIGQYLSGFSPGIHSDVFRVADPLPAMVEHWRLCRVIGRGVIARLSGGRPGRSEAP